MNADLIVLGTGPAGTAAALEAASHGLHVILIDEARAAGSQVYRAPVMAGLPPDPDATAGTALRAALAASPVMTRFGHRIWTVTPGYRVETLGPDGPATFEAPRVIAATGAIERLVPFPGWTLPGVIGLAAATILLKSQGMAPGRRIVVAGCGPLLAAVAAKLAKAGVTVVAVADLSGPADWLRAIPGLATRPDLLATGLGWAIRLGRARIPVLFRHTVRAAEGNDAVERIRLAPVDADGAPTGDGTWFDADALCVGHGLLPGAEITRLLQAPHRFDAATATWQPVRDHVGRTLLPGLYTAGDGATIAGAVPAALAGTLAGRAAAQDAGRSVPDSAPLHRRLARAHRFAAAINRLLRPRPGLVAAIPDETIVCRCEDVTRAEIEAAIQQGAHEVNQLKHFTRCGMGPCQGRFCADTAAALMARHTGSKGEAGCWTMRPPLRPVPLEALLGHFSYDDIPVPEPAPL